MKRSRFNKTGWSLACLLLLLFGINSIIAASEPRAEESANGKGKDKSVDKNDKSDDVIKIPIELVLMDVSVLDHSHRSVSGLDRKQFQIFEDKSPQKIEFFSRENVPV